VLNAPSSSGGLPLRRAYPHVTRSSRRSQAVASAQQLTSPLATNRMMTGVDPVPERHQPRRPRFLTDTADPGQACNAADGNRRLELRTASRRAAGIYQRISPPPKQVGTKPAKAENTIQKVACPAVSLQFATTTNWKDGGRRTEAPRGPSYRGAVVFCLGAKGDAPCPRCRRLLLLQRGLAAA